jgi:hypothetical protein
MPALEVGQPYVKGRTQWPEAAEYTYRRGQHELRLFMDRPTAHEVEVVRSGLSRFALAVTGPVIWLLFIFGNLPWNEAVFNIHLVPEAERQPPPAPTRVQQRASLQVVLVDASTGLVQALRVLAFSGAFTNALHGAIQAQLDQDWPGLDTFDMQRMQIASVYRNRDIAKELAVASCTGGIEGTTF